MYKILITLLLLVGNSYAATFNVSTTAEFRQALLDAAQNGQDDTVSLADGVYKTTDDGKGMFRMDGNEGRYDLTIQGSSSANVILSGDNQDRILFYSTTVITKLTLKNISFIDGNTNTNGGGVYSSHDTVIIDCEFTNNNAQESGGGFYCLRSTTITNTIFINNKAGDMGGGYFSFWGTTVTGSTFNNNSSVDNGGGFSSQSQEAVISNSTFYDNKSTDWGGGFSALDTTVSNSIFSDNNASIGGGGFNASYAIVDKSIFNNNMGTFSGGGFSSGNTAKVTNSIFTKNSSDTGGGFKAWDTAIVANVLFSSNKNSIHLVTRENNIISNSIFQDSIGSDVWGTSIASVTIENSYINPDKINLTNIQSNNIFNGVTLGFVDEDNGDYNLTVSSDLIDVGTTTITGLTLPTTDLNGNTRIVGDGIDIGPYEYQFNEPNIPTNVIASDGTLESVVGVSWSEVANAEYYNIYRSELQNDVGEIIGVSTSTSFVDDTILENTKYYYRVNACNDVGCSDYSVADSGYIGQLATPINPAIIMYLLN